MAVWGRRALHTVWCTDTHGNLPRRVGASWRRRCGRIRAGYMSWAPWRNVFWRIWIAQSAVRTLVLGMSDQRQRLLLAKAAPACSPPHHSQRRNADANSDDNADEHVDEQRRFCKVFIQCVGKLCNPHDGIFFFFCQHFAILSSIRCTCVFKNGKCWRGKHRKYQKKGNGRIF